MAREANKRELELALERLRSGGSIDASLGVVASEYGREAREAVSRTFRDAILTMLDSAGAPTTRRRQTA